MRRSLPLLLTFALFAFIAASCSDDGDAQTEEDSWKPCPKTATAVPHPTGATDIVLRLETTGGFPPPAYMPDDLPHYTIYGDGRLVAVDPNNAGLVPSLVERRLTEDEIQQLLHGAEAACLVDQEMFLDLPEVYDVPGASFIVDKGSGPQQTVAIGLGWSEMDPNVPANQEGQRAALLAFQSSVSNLLLPPPGGDVVPVTPLETDRLGVFFTKADSSAQGSDWPSVDWPLQVPLPDFGTASPEAWPEVQCAIAEGSDVKALLATVEGMPSDQSPYWVDGDTWYQLMLRPMLAEETNCAALVA
jgi:hypothetical protein